MSGLLAPVLAIETGEKCLQIVLVHRIVEALDSCRRRRLHARVPSEPLLSSRVGGRITRAILPALSLMRRARASMTEVRGVTLSDIHSTSSVGAITNAWFAQRSVPPIIVPRSGCLFFERSDLGERSSIGMAGRLVRLGGARGRRRRLRPAKGRRAAAFRRASRQTGEVATGMLRGEWLGGGGAAAGLVA